MKRWQLSILIGFVIAFGYAVGTDSLTGYVSNDTHTLLRLPVMWPSHLYFYLFPLDPNRKLVLFDELAIGNLLFLIIGNVLVHSLLTYAFLSWRNIPKPLK
jgi:hypothetical protein